VVRVSRPDVNGGLAVSRGFGDAFLKSPLPLLTCEPSVSSTLLHHTDEFIIIASDGAPFPPVLEAQPTFSQPREAPAMAGHSDGSLMRSPNASSSALLRASLARHGDFAHTATNAQGCGTFSHHERQ
jgi:hypothetical protein